MLSSYTCFGKNHLHFESIDSTNTFAQELLSKSSPMDGTVISADFQTAGKGQFDRQWLSNPGENLCFSLILYPGFLEIDQQFYLSMAIAWSLAEAIEKHTGLKTQIKWPNDIYIDNKKLGGILIVNQVSGSKWSSSVVGIGINVNQKIFHAALPNPTSISLETQKDFHCGVLLKLILSTMEDEYHHYLKGRKFEELRLAYFSKLMGYRQTIEFSFSGEGAPREGKIAGVDDYGRLQIEAGDNVLSFANGEVVVKY